MLGPVGFPTYYLIRTAQTVMGGSVLEIAPATVATGFLLVAWSAIAAFAFWRWAFFEYRASS